MSRFAVKSAVMLMVVWASAQRAARAEVPPADLALAAHGSSEFAFDLYARLAAEPGNLSFSPYSLSTALAMTYAGAKGDTAKQMADVLHFQLGPEFLHRAMAGLAPADGPNPGKAGYEFQAANALWGQKGYGFRDEFLALVAKHYGGGLREVDFAGATEAARKTINAWVADQTRQKIRELLKPDEIDAGTAIVLTNAIYFKGQWVRRFDAKKTRNGDFQVSSSKKVTVPMMHQIGVFRFAGLDGLNLLVMPYRGNRLSMVLLLPDQVDGLAELEKKLNHKNLRTWLSEAHEDKVPVSLPRFTVDSRYELSKTLKAMGMRSAFSPGADFSGMTPRNDLHLTVVAHQARVEVNEVGTEATAATGAAAGRMSAPASFIADHPFIFLIRDDQTGNILFIGRVVEPKGS